MTLSDLQRRFPDEATAQAHLFGLRWPKGKVACPRCKSDEKIYRRSAKSEQAVSYRWTCKSCNKNGYGFSLTTGTIFEDTKLPLDKWFQILLLMLSAKKGMSALQVQRTVFGQAKRRTTGKVAGKGSYESTWYACHRIRAAMKNPNFRRLMGVVEIDETYVGGSDRNRHKNKRVGIAGPTTGGTKVAVIGAIARKGNVTCQVLERVTGNKMDEFVRRSVSSKVSLIATDEHQGYARLGRHFPHETVTHSKGEYVRGDVHTAHLDSFWSLLKRGIMGTFHRVSKDHLPLYLNEFSYRHNARGQLTSDVFDRVLESC